jgi:hypothetical protein
MLGTEATRGSWRERIQRFFDRATTLGFVAAIVLPLVALTAGWDLREGVEDEKRAPTPFPEWSWTPAELHAYPQRFDAWFQDHFGLRRLLIRGHSMLSYYVLRTSPSPKVILGRNGWLYYDGVHAGDGDPIGDYRGIREQTPYQLETWRWAYQDIHDWFQERNVRFLLVLVPAKERIYPEYLPGYLAPVGPSAMDEVVPYLERHGRFAMLDLTPVLRAARGGEPLYAKTDTHWNAYGALVGYRAIVERLRQWYPALRPWSPSDFRVGWTRDRGGDLAQMMDLRRALTEETPVVQAIRPRRGTVQITGDPDIPVVVSEVDDPGLPRAVVFRDSFGNALIPYLYEHFRYALYAWSRKGVDLAPVVAGQPELVLHVAADRGLGHRFRYSTVIQNQANARRFDGSTDVLATIDGATDFRGIRPLRGSVARQGEGLLVAAEAVQAQLELPPVPRREGTLPILQVDVTAPGKTDLIVQWDNPRPGPAPPGVRYDVSGPIERGRTRITLPLLDPEMVGPLRLQFGHKGKYLLHRIEVRGIPRY